MSGEHQRSRSLVTWLCAAVLVIGGMNCSGGSDTLPTSPVTPVSVASVTISGAPASGVMLAGQSVTLVATAHDAGGAPVANAPVMWVSSNPAVVSVSSSGAVNALAVGSANISATAGAQTAGVALVVQVQLATPPAGTTTPVTSTVLNGAVSLTSTSDAVPPGAVLTVAPATDSLPASTLLVPNSAYSFGPNGTQFAKPVTLAIKFDTSVVAPSARPGLAIYWATNGAWTEIAGSLVSATSGTVSVQITHFSVYAILKRAAPASAFAVAGDGESVSPGIAVPVGPAIRVLDALGLPVPFVPVMFSVTSGGGTATGTSALTDLTGTATVGGWTMGPTAGANTMTAAVAGLGGNGIVFTATAVVGAPASLVANGGSTTGISVERSPCRQACSCRTRGEIRSAERA